MARRRPRLAVPDAKLLAGLKHLRYEIRMFKATAIRLMTGAMAGDTLQRNAVLESFTIHTRNLLQFFYPDGPGSDEMLATDYFGNPDDWKRTRGRLPDLLKDIRDRVGTEIAHLTYARVDISDAAKQWNLAQMWLDISTILTRFVETIEPRYRASLLEGMPIEEIDEVVAQAIDAIPPSGSTLVTHMNTPTANQAYAGTPPKKDA